ncbi:MAG: ROK family transcriptional regulator [Oscillospiraceae bacterium]|nr:ROK family transcriptional regulator [Oscillospiraceae bacterium]
MPFEGDNMMGVKRNNRSAALRILHEKGEMSRKRLAESMKLTPAAITKIVGEMLGEGLLLEGEAVSNGTAGRREIMVRLNERCCCALGIMINIPAAVVSAVWLDGSVIFSEELAIERNSPAEPTVSRLCSRLMELAEKHGIKRDSMIGVGVAVRGVTSQDGRSSANSFGAFAEAGYPVCDRVEALTGLRVVMTNNVRALFAAHMFLSHDEAEGSQFFLRCEYGIGASLSIDGRIWHGVTEQCTEIGHIPVVRRGGKPCVCGKSGCLETIASPTAIRDDALERLSQEQTPVLWKLKGDRAPEELSLEDVLNAACSGDEGAAEVVDRAVSTLGGALKSVIYLVDPGKIVLYGRMFDNPYYLSRLLSEVREGVDAAHTVEIRPSAYNHRLEDKAAGLLAVEDFFDNGGIR